MLNTAKTKVTIILGFHKRKMKDKNAKEPTYLEHYYCSIPLVCLLLQPTVMNQVCCLLLSNSIISKWPSNLSPNWINKTKIKHENFQSSSQNIVVRTIYKPFKVKNKFLRAWEKSELWPWNSVIIVVVVLFEFKDSEKYDRKSEKLPTKLWLACPPYHFYIKLLKHGDGHKETVLL